MSARKRAYSISLAILALIVVGIGGLVVGAISPHSSKPPFRWIAGAASRLAEELRAIGKDAPPTLEENERRYGSIFVPLSGRVIRVPHGALEGKGGGLATLGDRVLLLTFDGRFYAARSDGEIERLHIEPPPNAFADYRAASARPPYDEYEHRLASFRYNDVDVHDGAGGRALLVSYTKWQSEEECYVNALDRAPLPAVGSDAGIEISAADWQVLFRSSPCLPLKAEWRALEGHMAGGRIEVDDAAERVYLSSGEYHWDGVYGPASPPGLSLPTSQDPKSDYGKILAIDLASGESRHLSRGHRNVQGIVSDSDGGLWAVEHGPRGGDELNRIEPGADFGWPYETHGTQYNALPWPSARSLGRHDGATRPVFSWLPSIAPSGLTRIEGFHEAWDGDLLVATLRGEKLVRLRIAEGRVVFAEDIPVNARIRSVHQHVDGTLVLWTDGFELIFLRPREGGLAAAFVERYIGEELPRPLRASVRSALRTCTQCHSLDRGHHVTAPSLGEIVGVRAGSSDFRGYSAALASSRKVWTRERLDAFLRDPQATFPGTSMPRPEIPDDATRRALIDVLDALANSVE